MYDPDTILELKEPKPDEVVEARKDPDTGRTRPKHKIPFPYNKVRVVGQSPVDHSAGRQGTWQGAAAQSVLIEPLSGHGSTLDEPLGKIQKLYKVVSVPSNEILVEPIRVVRSTSASAGPSPEEVFAKESPGVPPKPGQNRGRTSPLGDVEDDSAARSPLGD